jgi:hypothetical protein
MAAEVDPSSQRVDAAFRILLAALYSWTIYPFVWLIGAIGGFVYMGIDVLIQLWKGNSGVSAYGGNATTAWGKRLFNWPIDQGKYIVGTRDSFPVLP